MRAIAFCLILMAVPAAAASTSQVDLSYRLGSDFRGTVAAACDSFGVLVPRGAHVLEGSQGGGTLTEYEVVMNSTAARDPTGELVEIQSSKTVKLSNHSVSPGAFRIETGDHGRSDLFAPRGAEMPSIRVSWDGSGLREGPVMGPVPAYTHHVQPTLREPAEHHVSMLGPQREIEGADGRATVRGDIVVVMEDATFADGRNSFTAPKRETNRSWTPVPGLALRTTELRYALIQLKDIRLTFPASGARAFCSELHGTLDGTLTTYETSGSITTGPKVVSFDQRELTVGANLSWTERIADGTVVGHGEGQVRSVLVDYATATEWPLAQAAAQIGLATLLLAALAAAFWKGFSPLFSRLNEASVVGQERRKLVLDAVKAKPNITLKDVMASTGLSQSDVRYHARILEQHGLVRSHKILHERCFVARDTIRALGKAAFESGPDAIRKRDPVVDAVVRHAPPTHVRMSHVMGRVAAEQGVSKVAAWKGVHRANRHGFVELLRIEHEVWLRRKHDEAGS